MNLKRLTAALGAALLTVCVLAAPARRGVYSYSQPDGSTVRLLLSGDEFSRTLTTLDGCHVCKDAAGFYCYASFQPDGRKVASGYRVGAKAPASVLAASRAAVPALASRRVEQLRAAEDAQRLRTLTARRARLDDGEKPVHKVFVLLAEFADLKFQYTRDDFVNLLTQEGYSDNGATGSALDYFKAQFGDSEEFEFEVSPIVTLSQNFAYYGENSADGYDKRPGELITEGCALCDEAVDFSQFDTDEDGIIDIVFAFYAGGDEAHGVSEDHIWSHQSVISKSAVTVDGVRPGKYAVTSELYGLGTDFTRIGTFCHEYSHCLGLMDLYDTDYEQSGGLSTGVWGSISIMDSGNYNNEARTPPNYTAVELDALGIGSVEPLGLSEYTLDPISSGQKYYKYSVDDDGEYFLVEARQSTGWDKYIGGSGLLVYHIDRSQGPAGFSTRYGRELTAAERWMAGEVNSNPAHMCAKLVTAKPSATQPSDAFFPNGTISSLKPSSHPDYMFWQETSSLFSITDIRLDSSTGAVSFSVAGPLSINKIDAFQDAAIVNWSSNSPDLVSTINLIHGRDTVSVDVKPYEGSNYSYTFEGLNAKDSYKVQISVPSDETSITVSATFDTRAYYKDLYPFIYMSSVSRNEDGSVKSGEKLPLRVYNGKDAVEVVWTLDGKEIKAGGDGYWMVCGGLLEAEVHYADGRVTRILKLLTVR